MQIKWYYIIVCLYHILVIIINKLVVIIISVEFSFIVVVFFCIIHDEGVPQALALACRGLLGFVFVVLARVASRWHRRWHGMICSTRSGALRRGVNRPSSCG